VSTAIEMTKLEKNKDMKTNIFKLINNSNHLFY